jgi:uncharacterized protein with NRDE domain
MLALYYRVIPDYPLIVAANRDERFSRASASPQRLDDEPLIFGGKDLVAGGTWLGVNEYGLIAGVLNRRAAAPTTKHVPRSRGLLCLQMLRAASAFQAYEGLKREHGLSYQPFLLLVASVKTAFVAYNSGKTITHHALDTGVHVFGNSSFCGTTTEKLIHSRELFSAATGSLRQRLTPTGVGEKRGGAKARLSSVDYLQRILGNHDLPAGSHDPRDAICVHGEEYGTVSSSIVFQDSAGGRFHFYHSSIAPCEGEYHPIEAPGPL